MKLKVYLHNGQTNSDNIRFSLIFEPELNSTGAKKTRKQMINPGSAKVSEVTPAKVIA
jgi:hypothetical protein